MYSLLLPVLALLGAQSTVPGDVPLDLTTATLTLTERGVIRSLVFADGTSWPDTATPVFTLQTAQGQQRPRSLHWQDQLLTVEFTDGSRAMFNVHTAPGFALFRLKELDTKTAAQSLELFQLAVPSEATHCEVLNAASFRGVTAALMAAEPNVETRTSSLGSRGDRAGCSHTFVPVSEAKSGQQAVRFTATSNAQAGGWSVQGNSFSAPIDLSGCQAIRVWVHGDGQRELLKIQLHDGSGGYRDDYQMIDFQGWRQITLNTPALETLQYAHVASINFYYNDLPANHTVSCLLDRVEAIVTRNGQTQVIPLEDFEDPSSPLWSEPLHTLTVRTAREHGVQPAAFAFIASPQDQFFSTVERFEQAAGILSPQLDGVWNKRSPWIKRSYFFLTNFSEKQYDEALAIARRGGFDMILLDQSSWCASTGHYEINRDRFPDGLDGLKRTFERFRRDGFKVGLHVLADSIDPPDPYLTPIPDPRLVKDRSVTLAEDVDDKSDFIPTAEAPAGFPEDDGGYMSQGKFVQLGNELISYSRCSAQPPFGLVGCHRGLLGTKATSHAKGAQVAHLRRSYGYFLFDMDTSLLDEVTANLARVANGCGAEMLYFDGSEALQGDHWYYNARLHKAVYDKLRNKNVLLQASSFSHYSWHLLARSASADGHGDLKGYLDERSPAFDVFARNGMPLDIGWYYGYDTSATPDMYEYILGATIGYDSSMSFQVSPAAARKHPFTGEILDLIARYEKLRLSGRVPPEMRQRLRIDPALGGQKTPQERESLLDRRRDYRLLETAEGQAFQRVYYTPWHQLSALDGQQDHWPIEVRQGPARIGIQIQAIPGPWTAAGPSYDSPDALLLEAFDDLAPYTGNPQRHDVHTIGPGEAGAVLPGVTQRFESTDDGPRAGTRCAVYTATSGLDHAGGWSVIGRTWERPLNLSQHKGLGFWLRGDGHGGQFKLQLCDASGALDYYVANDFTGWRYQQLAWPEKLPIDLHAVQRLLFYYNGLPSKATVSCGIDDVKALPALDPHTLSNPWLELNGRRFAWAGTLHEGQYLLFWPRESLIRYGHPQTQPEVLPVPEETWELPEGKYEVHFGTNTPLQVPVRVRITLQSAERHLIPL